MSRFLPKSLFGQTLLILAWRADRFACGRLLDLYTADREQAVRAVGGFAAAQRIANLTRLVQETPREWRGTHRRRVERSDLPRFAFRSASRHCGADGSQ